ncbi:hypothetical protein BG004_008243 [Podila humilis]|nr:hypothetical protein BG004_008243 [Podila humilis]
MGSSVSKSKKNRQSTSSLPSKKTKKSRPRAASDASIPQNPRQWSQDNYNGNSEIMIDGQHNQGKIQASTSNRTSGNNNSPNPNNASQPRTSTSNGRPSFSLLRGRKSNQLPRSEQDYVSNEYIGPPRRPQPILHISAPMIEPTDDSGGGALFGTSLPEQAPRPPRQYKPRPSVEGNRYHCVEPPRSTSGAYKAKAPALPISAQFGTTTIQQHSPQSTPLLSDAPSFPPPPPPSSSLAQISEFPSPPQVPVSQSQLTSHHEDSQSLWRESLRNAAEGRKGESGLTRSSSNNSVSTSQSYSSSAKGSRRRKPLSGSTFASSLSPSSSSASQSSFGPNRKRSGKLISGDTSPRNKEFWTHRRSENSSMLSLPGSRYIGNAGSTFGDEEGDLDYGSIMGSKNHSDPSFTVSQLVGPSGVITNSPSLVGVNTLNDRYDNQFPSPRHSQPSQHNQHQSQSQPSSPQKRWSQAASDFGAMDTEGLFKSPSRTRPRKNISGRESMSSISTANYQWMDEQPGGSSDRDTANRNSVMMLFDAAKPPPPLSASPLLMNPEQIAQQHEEQEAQQHALLKYFFKGNYTAPFDKQTLGSVLDVGCGVGMWMKDMALEFPLTEIHGLDLVVPTRRRRPRATAPVATSSPTQSSFSSGRSDPHTSTQSNASSSRSGYESSSSGNPHASTAVYSPVMMDSMPSNCFFHKADVTHGLPFADNSFDYCHVRLMLWGYRLNAFPDLLEELIRVTKKDGWIEFVDMDPCLKKATDTGTRINEWIKTGLIHSNMDPDLVKTLPKILKEYCEATVPKDPKTPSARDSDLVQVFGLDHLNISKISLPFGPWGGKVGELWQQNFTRFLKELEPMMIDATLSGLIMDQYHRQCLNEMLQMATEASRQSGSSGAGERITSFDQKICTHKAWMHLVDQLISDASYSVPTDSNRVSTTSGSKTAPSSPSKISFASIKEMRSYNNFFIMYAQKVDLMELKQQILLQKLEQTILSPNMGSPPATFASRAPALFDISAENPESSPEQHVTGHTGKKPSTLFDEFSMSESKQPLVYQAKAEDNEHSQPGMVASLTESALEILNKGNNGGSDNCSSNRNNIRGDSALSNVMSPGSSAPPTPTSVAALSVRSSSRMSNNNGSGSSNEKNKSQGTTLPGTPGSVTSSTSYHTPRAEASTQRAMIALRRDGSVKSELGSPQPQARQMSDSDSNSNKRFVPDYFNQVPIHSPVSSYHNPASSYHQQQYNHHYQQQVNAINRKPSLLTRVLAPSAEAQQMLKDRSVDHTTVSQEVHGDETEMKEREMVSTTGTQDTASEHTTNSFATSGDDAEGSVILIPLGDENEQGESNRDDLKCADSDGSVSRKATSEKEMDREELEEEDEERGDNTIKILNSVSEEGGVENESATVDDDKAGDEPLQMLDLDDEEVFVMMAPDSHSGSIQVDDQVVQGSTGEPVEAAMARTKAPTSVNDVALGDSSEAELANATSDGSIIDIANHKS